MSANIENWEKRRINYRIISNFENIAEIQSLKILESKSNTGEKPNQKPKIQFSLQ